MANTCGRCVYWIDFQQAFDDPEEPTDFGYCQNKSQLEECTPDDFSCEYFKDYSED